MRKFRPLGEHTTTKQHIFNVPKRGIKTQDSLLSQARTLHNIPKHCELKQNSAIGEGVSKVSIRTSKTRQECRAAREQAVNARVAKETIKKMKRVKTEGIEAAYQLKVICLKKYVNQLTRTCNAVKKKQGPPISKGSEGTINEERRKFLMGQLSFTQIDEEKIMAQRKFLSKFDHLSKSLSKAIVPDSGSFSPSKESEQRVLECLRAIDRIYKVILDMQGEGYAIKTNKYVIEYCANGRVWMKKIFLYESGDKKDAFTVLVKYYVVGSAEQAKEKFSGLAGRAGGEELRMVQEEIEGLHSHLQHCLTQKKLLQVMNITEYIECRMKEEGKYLGRALRFTLPEHDKTALTRELAALEQRHGAMREITKLSRRRYDELSRSYERLRLLNEGS